jgi:RNA polymerase sigma-54 factor
MAQGLRQTQSQTLKLSPQQIQLMKLLQVPTDSLEERIDIEIQENPALEYKEEGEDKSLEEKTQQEVQDEFKSDDNDDYVNDYDDYGNVDVSSYLGEADSAPAYAYGDNYYDQDADDETAPRIQHKLEKTFREHLTSQIELLELKDAEKMVAEFLVGSIDDDGYLRRDVTSLRDDLAFRQNIQIDEPSLLYILDRVKEMEPAGVFAGNLRECLLLQLLRKTANEPRLLAVKVLENYFEEFSKKHYKKIIRGLHINEELMKEVLDEILKLNPKPGGVLTITNKAATYMVPDFTVINNDGELELRLNSRNAPDLRVSGTYRTMLETYRDTKKKTKEQKDAVMFIKQKIDSAKWFIDAIKQRQQTLTMTMDVIIRLQEKFFLSGDETNIRPMILKDISDRTGFDISTISRVVNSKFVQTEFGTFKLKYFFSESLTTTDGDDVSTKEVKKILQDIIAEESKKKPLSDEKLTNLLKEKSYNIARRTVAKYREQLNIPVARLRKEL